jgi:phage FluMu protein Com
MQPAQARESNLLINKVLQYIVPRRACQELNFFYAAKTEVSTEPPKSRRRKMKDDKANRIRRYTRTLIPRSLSFAHLTRHPDLSNPVRLLCLSKAELSKGRTLFISP